MSSRAKIDDISTLGHLRSSLRAFSENVNSPLNIINGELHDTLGAMKNKLNEFREEKDQSQERLHRAEAARYQCESSQRFDEEDNSYHPSCEFERATERIARSQYNEICRRCEMAEAIYRDVEYEISQYFSGAEKYLRNEQSNLLDADEKLCTITEAVEKILGTSISTSGVSSPKNNGQPTTLQNQKTKKTKFNEATTILKNRITNIERCPYCGRPIKICRCPMDPLERERLMIERIKRNQR